MKMLPFKNPEEFQLAAAGVRPSTVHRLEPPPSEPGAPGAAPTQVWPGGAARQPPAETVPGGWRGRRWGDHHAWEKGGGIGQGPPGAEGDPEDTGSTNWHPHPSNGISHLSTQRSGTKGLPSQPLDGAGGGEAMHTRTPHRKCLPDRATQATRLQPSAPSMATLQWAR